MALLDGGHALLVRYRYCGNGATAVDTVAATSIRVRIEADPVLDQPVAYPGQLSAHDPTLLPVSGAVEDFSLPAAGGRPFGWQATPAPARVQLAESNASRDQTPEPASTSIGCAVQEPR